MNGLNYERVILTGGPVGYIWYIQYILFTYFIKLLRIM